MIPEPPARVIHAGACAGCADCQSDIAAVARACGVSFTMVAAKVSEARALTLEKLAALARPPASRAERRRRERDEARARARRAVGA